MDYSKYRSGTEPVTNRPPVVQSIVRLLKPLITDLLYLIVLTNRLQQFFLAEKLKEAFAQQKLLTFFLAINGSVFTYDLFENLLSL